MDNGEHPFEAFRLLAKVEPTEDGFISLRERSLADIDVRGHLRRTEWQTIIDEEHLNGIPAASPFRLRMIVFGDHSALVLREDTEDFAKAMTWITGNAYEPRRMVALAEADTFRVLQDLLDRAERDDLTRASEPVSVAPAKIDAIIKQLGFPKPQWQTE